MPEPHFAIQLILCLAAVSGFASCVFVPRDDGSQRYSRETVGLCSMAIGTLAKLVPEHVGVGEILSLSVVALVLAVVETRAWRAARGQLRAASA